MQFDARAAKLLEPGQHLTIDGCPGLRLTATATTRTWSYRFKSPVDDKMRQQKIGRWPEISFAAAMGAWDALRQERASGVDPVKRAKEARAAAAEAQAAERGEKDAGALSVADVCSVYLTGHIETNRAAKGQAEIKRTLETMVGELAGVSAASVTRAQAFELINSYAHIPVQAQILRRELGAAWEYCHDAGKLPESVPNWWRVILRGKLKSKGKAINGVKAGVKKRVLSPAEAGELIRWLPNFSPDIQDILALYLWTAARGAEITVMEAGEISEEADGLWWTVPKAKTKNVKREEATDFRVPLVGRAEEIVRRRLEGYPEGYLFPSYGKSGHWEQKSVQTRVYYQQPYSKTAPERKRQRLTVTHWAPHDLRRTARTFLASLKCPRDVAEVILGHMLEGVEGDYNRYSYDKERRLWLRRLSEYLEKLAKRGS
ncbi:integrase arm-type DNA-binding domain-containing protein [Achromobacter sp. UMC46]|uniref:tyrosine-type recombinase/integrase n=1 Tax=Achromobacter sp. UMC46 TaxID=1862319 RepID=UPI0015FEC556|nr:integrase arm-type DNA-binding domain-containing protein [Achromobacter sp. UMC46]MBB1593560.1 alpha/beta hydrolase [Achromobacter sp. UMC46]